MDSNLIEQELENFDYVRWTVICRAMMLRIARGQYEGAHAGLRDFCRQPFRVAATVESSVATVFSVRIANQLELGGYYDVDSVRMASDEDLRAIENTGPKTIREIRETIEKVLRGELIEVYGEGDEELIDPELCARITPPAGAIEGTMTNQEQVLAAIELLATSPDTARDVIDRQIAVHETAIKRLQQARRMVTFGPLNAKNDPTVARDEAQQSEGGGRVRSQRRKQGEDKWAGLAQKIVDYLTAEGSPRKPNMNAEALGVHAIQVGKAVTSCRELYRRGDGRVQLAEALAGSLS